MVGDGQNRKSMAYVENVAAFIEHAMTFEPGIHLYNYIDKPDFMMDDLVVSIRRTLGKPERVGLRIPYAMGYMIGEGFDVVSSLTGYRFPISSIRVKKFCANTVFNSAVEDTEFKSPVPLKLALERTVRYEFMETHQDEHVFYSE